MVDAASLVGIDDLMGNAVDLFLVLQLHVFLEERAVEMVDIVVQAVDPL